MHQRLIQMSQMNNGQVINLVLESQRSAKKDEKVKVTHCVSLDQNNYKNELNLIKTKNTPQIQQQSHRQGINPLNSGINSQGTHLNYQMPYFNSRQISKDVTTTSVLNEKKQQMSVMDKYKLERQMIEDVLDQQQNHYPKHQESYMKYSQNPEIKIDHLPMENFLRVKSKCSISESEAINQKNKAIDDILLSPKLQSKDVTIKTSNYHDRDKLSQNQASYGVNQKYGQLITECNQNPGALINSNKEKFNDKSPADNSQLEQVSNWNLLDNSPVQINLQGKLENQQIVNFRSQQPDKFTKVNLVKNSLMKNIF
ncbi:UNKNOWN [Stylonychia lemnae]|uniref:Uncharacterized protein n=1 Tax=Stylonychia lemnae TaxID=5949 RepID=A0A078BAQ4_STYLE|nr:UNKNOWN [Stylonychia lemnae]|eukprot:CDW91439.1 UNKNOWN [Stylonychia lemnae]